MKMPSVSTIISSFLLIVFTLQVTNLTCVGEGLHPNAPGIQSEYQLKSADSDKGNSAYSHAAMHGHCQCPCHLSFLQFPSTEVISYQTSGLPLTFAGDPCLKKVSANIFQPPKVLI